MAITITKNQKFFDELASFNPKLARILDEEHGWTDKLVHRSTDASISQSTRRPESTQKISNEDPIAGVVPSKVGRN